MISSSGAPILVVDDEALVRRAVVRTLVSAGIFCVEACDEQEALAAFAGASPPIAAVLDLQLAMGSGVDLARAIGLCAPGTPVIFISGQTAPRIPEGVSFVAVLEKPFERAQLIRAISAALAR